MGKLFKKHHKKSSENLVSIPISSIYRMRCGRVIVEEQGTFVNLLAMKQISAAENRHGVHIRYKDAEGHKQKAYISRRDCKKDIDLYNELSKRVDYVAVEKLIGDAINASYQSEESEPAPVAV